MLGIAIFKTGIVLSCVLCIKYIEVKQLYCSKPPSPPPPPPPSLLLWLLWSLPGYTPPSQASFFEMRFTNSIPNWQRNRFTLFKPNESQAISITVVSNKIKQEMVSLSLSGASWSLFDFSIGCAKDH